ncbi:hypothetical protein Tsp_10134 [Trichinella spiralis]|uniref:hypothetical protein n=1 Tax=Trichinella spiralis TaxID=6334 RepID=UPI0001EFB39E|nr:hypothetical protein Tsp_10134 [Trichinella spiralis]
MLKQSVKQLQQHQRSVLYYTVLLYGNNVLMTYLNTHSCLRLSIYTDDDNLNIQAALPSRSDLFHTQHEEEAKFEKPTNQQQQPIACNCAVKSKFEHYYRRSKQRASWDNLIS